MMKMKSFRVTELNRYISKIMMSNPILHHVSVQGEIFNLRETGYGYTFFSLKDDESKINCILNAKYPEDLKEGISVLVNGRVHLYEKNGTYSIMVHEWTLCGEGDRYREYLQLKEELQGLGYFDETHKKMLPKFPKTIGVITSAFGDAVQDIIQIIGRRYPLVELILFDVKVQGVEAVDYIVQGLKYFNEKRFCDLIVLARGGGSYDELSVFNDKKIAKEIFESEIPIVSAIGHENDYVISDLVADLRASTPSAAAELCVPNSQDIGIRLEQLRQNLGEHLEYKASRMRSKVEYYGQIFEILTPDNIYLDKKKKTEDRKQEMDEIIKEILKKKYTQIDRKFIELDALSPAKIIKRGYAVVEKDGRILSSSKNISMGDKIETKVADGSFVSKVIEVYSFEDEKNEYGKRTEK